jgi:oligoribonuclease NrnB/cAMP/cGMP phosphodiesterase (DHH superfamily)
MNKKLILTHANCVDGCCSRAILEQAHGENALYLAVDYPDFKPEYAERYEKLMSQVKDFKNTEVIMADICLPNAWIDMFLKNENKVTIIDHHATSLKMVENYQERIDNGEKLNLEIIFSKDNTESGAMLTWKYCNPTLNIPDVIKYVSEGDTWNFKSPETKPFYFGIKNEKEPKDYSSEFWINLINNKEAVNSIIESGKPLLDSHNKVLDSFAKEAKPITIDNKQGFIVQAPRKYCSDLGDILAKQCNGFALIYEQKPDLVTCELRSVKPVTVNDIAEKLGGGGHKHAAGFRVKDLNELQQILNDNNNNVDLTQYVEQKKSIVKTISSIREACSCDHTFNSPTLK